MTIEVHAGENLSGITFNVPTQKTYSVRGVLSIHTVREQATIECCSNW